MNNYIHPFDWSPPIACRKSGLFPCLSDTILTGPVEFNFHDQKTGFHIRDTGHQVKKPAPLGEIADITFKTVWGEMDQYDESYGVHNHKIVSKI